MPLGVSVWSAVFDLQELTQALPLAREAPHTRFGGVGPAADPRMQAASGIIVGSEAPGGSTGALSEVLRSLWSAADSRRRVAITIAIHSGGAGWADKGA